MAIKRTTFTCTTSALGVAEDDARLSGTITTGARHSFLEAVRVNDSAATLPALAVRIYQLEDDDNGDEQEGTLLFSALNPVSDGVYYPRVAGHDEFGVALSGATGRILLRSTSVRVSVEGGATGDVYTVTVYHETAGDYRF